MFLNPGKTGPLFQRSRDSQPFPVANGSRAPRAGICGPVNGPVSWTRRRGLETAGRQALAVSAAVRVTGVVFSAGGQVGPTGLGLGLGI